MVQQRLPPEVLETAQQKLKAFRARLNRLEWKAFKVVNADEDITRKLISAHKYEDRLLKILEAKTRLPCVVCQGQQGIIYCSLTYTSRLSQRETLSHTRFKPPVYCVFYPGETLFFTTRASLPDVVENALVDLLGGSDLKKMPLVGKDFRSLRQLHYNKLHNGMICRRSVKDTHPVENIQMQDESSPVPESGMIVDEDLPWKKRKEKYYRKHFCPEKDPVITKFTISNSSRFRGIRATRQLNCDLKVTFRTENLLKFFDYSMDKGILNYPLKPFLAEVVRCGRTAISLNETQ